MSISSTVLRRWLREVNPRTLSHLAALMGVGAAIALTWLFWPVMDRNPLLFFLVAVAISAWYGGLWPGLTATGASVAALYMILLQQADAEPGARADGVLLDGYNASRLLLFTLACVLLAWFSERRRSAERASRRLDETFAKLFESASEAIVIVDEQGRIVRVNAAAEDMFGYARDELLEQPIEMLVPATLRQRHVHHRTAYLADPHNRPMGQNLDLRGVRKDGSEFPVEISLSYVRNGSEVRVMSFVTDITARKQTEASLAHYQEQLRQLAFESVKAEQRERRRIAVELHDRIGQTLALCQIKLGGVRGRLDDDAAGDLDDCVKLVAQSIEDTRDLTFELSPPVLYDLGLGAALHWLADEFREEHGFHVHVEADDAPALDDELASLVFRSVRELLINAVKHAEVAAADVRVTASPEALEIEVADEGVGFDVETAGRSAATTARFGLLSIREQIERLGGETKINSSPGHGTRVRLRVPVTSGATLEQGSEIA